MHTPSMRAPRQKKTSTKTLKKAGSARERGESRELVAGTNESELHDLLGQRVREARARRFMTRKALAEQSGVSIAYLSQVETGRGNISLGLLQKLAFALNLPIEHFFAAVEPRNADFTMIVEFLRRQSPERLAQIRRQLSETDDSSRRIALIGIRGVGKSTLVPLLAERLGVPFVELNREIEREAKLDVSEIFTLYGQHGYRVLERKCLERVISEFPRVVLATAGGIVAETPTYELLLTSFFTIWLKAKPQIMFEFVLAQHDARIASTELRKEALENITRTLDARQHLYELAAVSFDTSGKTPEQIASALSALVPTTPQARFATR